MMDLLANADPALPEPIKARLAVVDDRAQANCEAIYSSMHERIPHLNVRLNALLTSDAPKNQKVISLRAISDAFCAPLAKAAACRKGCGHCCHIGVPLTQTEANVIGKAIGRRARRIPPAERAVDANPGYHNPCPFLVNSACSIYEHRPLVCRSHLNMDDDDLLCRLLPGLSVPVPYANMSTIHTAYAEITMEPCGDIRQFFPRLP